MNLLRIIRILCPLFLIFVYWQNVFADTFIEGNLAFTPPRTDRVKAKIMLFVEERTIENLYIERKVDTIRPFSFRFQIDKSLQLGNLIVHVKVIEPNGYSCPYQNLKANQVQRLKDIPIYSDNDLYFLANNKLLNMIKNKDIDEAKNQYEIVINRASTPGQKTVPALDLVDFLSQYKNERDEVVDILTNIESNISLTNSNIQKRYWKTRRDSVMRLAGYNDFRGIPLHEFANVAASPTNAVSREWFSLTNSFSTQFQNSPEVNIPNDEMFILRENSPETAHILKQVDIMGNHIGN